MKLTTSLFALLLALLFSFGAIAGPFGSDQASGAQGLSEPGQIHHFDDEEDEDEEDEDEEEDW